MNRAQRLLQIQEGVKQWSNKIKSLAKKRDAGYNMAQKLDGDYGSYSHSHSDGGLSTLKPGISKRLEASALNFGITMIIGSRT